MVYYSDWKQKSIYSDDEKRQIVKNIFNSGLPLKKACALYSVSEGSYYNWRNALFDKKSRPMRPKGVLK